MINFRILSDICKLIRRDSEEVPQTTNFSIRRAIDKQIREGQDLRKYQDEIKLFPKIHSWVCTVEDLLRMHLPKDSTLAEEVQKQRKDGDKESKIDINSVIDTLERAWEILRAKDSEIERNSLKEEIRFHFNDVFLRSWWVRILLGIVLVVVAFVIYFAFVGVLQFRGYTIDVKGDVERQFREAEKEVMKRGDEAEEGIKEVVSNINGMEGKLRGEIFEMVESLVSDAKKRIKIEEEELGRQLLQKLKDASREVTDKLSPFVSGEKSRITSAVDDHIIDLKRVMAPEIADSLGDLLILSGKQQEQSDNLQNTIEEQKKLISPIVEKVALLKKDLTDLKVAIDELDSDKMSDIVQKLEPSIDRAKAVYLWFWVPSAIAIAIAIVCVICSVRCVWKR